MKYQISGQELQKALELVSKVMNPLKKAESVLYRPSDEDLFIEHYIPKNKYLQLEDKINSLKNSRLLKILYKLGIFKAYKYL